MKSVLSKEDKLLDYLKRYSFNSMQQYRTGYLLAKITQHVDMAYKGVNTIGTIDEYTVLEIEHILLDDPNSELRNDFISKNPEVDYDEYKNRLGNLTLLEKPINIVAGNAFFLKKVKNIKKVNII